MKKSLKITGIVVLAAATAGVAAAFLVREQISRHRRDLFSPYTLRRLAALGHVARQEASVDNINLLRDYLSWEPRAILRERARSVLQGMEEDLEAEAAHLRGG